MTYNGHVKDGVIVLDESIKLAEGTLVRVETVAPQPARPAGGWEQWIGIVKDGPEDLAEQHDHYIHGTPKR